MAKPVGWPTQTFAGLFVLVLLLFGAVHAWPDDAPLPGANEYAFRAVPRDAAQMRWLECVPGFLAAADADPCHVGRAAIERHNQGSGWSNPATLEPPLALQQCSHCAGRGLCCTANAAQHVLATQMLQYRTLLTRYQALWESAEFTSPLAPSYQLPQPDFTAVLATQHLWLAGIIAAPDRRASRDRLDRDLGHWRRVLAGTDVITAKLAATRAIAANLRVRALLARIDHRAGVLTGSARLAPLSPGERSVLAAMRHELGMDRWIFQHFDAFQRTLGTPRRDLALMPLKPHRTFNLHLAHNQPVMALAALSAAEYLDARPRLPPRLAHIGMWDRIINGQGVWALELADATEQYTSHMLALHDLSALVALTAMAEELVRQRVPAAGMADFVARAGPEFANPYFPRERPRVNAAHTRLFFENVPRDVHAGRIEVAIDLPVE